MKLISVVTPCYNEEQNVAEVYRQVKNVFEDLPQYKYEHLFIDNASSDKTVMILRELAKNDSNLKVIVNVRNFGHLRSPFYGILQARGDAVILVVSDLQDPPEMIKTFIKKWEDGYKIVVGVKPKSQENWLMASIRRMGYRSIAKISETPLIRNFTGFGLYDRSFVDMLGKLDDAYPYFRGMVSELGYSVIEIPYTQPKRKYGITKNNFYTLFDFAMLSLTSSSKVPLRIMTIFGFLLSLISLFFAMIFFILKLFFWKYFILGLAPILIGMFCFFSVQLFFIGMIGEYIAAIHTQVLKRPLVIEKERINF